jgi:dehydrogenase/reductase SDR family protein 4
MLAFLCPPPHAYSSKFEPDTPPLPLTRSKTALLGVARNLAHEWAAAGIRVNAIAPGIIKTQFSELLWKNEAATEAALQRIPLGRLGESHEIASVAAFLASSDANYVTGETIVVSGGMQASRL